MSADHLYSPSSLETGVDEGGSNPDRSRPAFATLEELACQNWRGFISDEDFRVSRATIQASLTTWPGDKD